jgi:hypothetical protein
MALYEGGVLQPESRRIAFDEWPMEGYGWHSINGLHLRVRNEPNLRLKPIVVD